MCTAAQRLGAAGEQAAAEYLSHNDYEILDRNWRCSAGELDAVARAGNGQIVAIEVKTRSSQRFGTGFDAINAQKYRRLHKLLILWAQAHAMFIAQPRIDIVEVYPSGDQYLFDLHQSVQP
ncbi:MULTISPECIES: YraN family protein [Micrococcaceae]|uniref:YraN family protein n=1 Tax=Micrococcaceae TaxID=1268 RepID=UPI001036BDE1|nr:MULTISPECIES: YraN family protein [Micrococcaceae]TAP27179.1 YraN family protein [Arthrobacter sp. S41]UXN31207.1 YraN family protein [Glutamicibacter sp. M10]